MAMVRIWNILITLAVIISCIYSCDPSFAKPLTVKGNFTKSISYLNIKDPDFKIINSNEELGRFKDNLKSFNLGLSFYKNNFSASITTNRIHNQETEKKVIQRKSGIEFLVKNRITTDILNIGYIYKRFLPSILLINTKLDKDLLYNNEIVSSTSKNAIMKGFNLGYFITKKDMIATYYLFEEKEFNIKDIIGVSYTRLF